MLQLVALLVLSALLLLQVGVVLLGGGQWLLAAANRAHLFDGSPLVLQMGTSNPLPSCQKHLHLVCLNQKKRCRGGDRSMVLPLL